ncbi:Site-specific DNA recombinase [Pseudorhodobacter antarcticus]|uniref:Site-specific DNA recombinase n=1 Tax=Pseudorhodobacter antarcticus TaxID=1077947 RepID=A0A1H8G0I4_9RHOB|nr:recombinase family protein [Pseudorhodobacter antarcticus]SEN37513.1 Site-specific DNA recombinase [Pseudorhodobacter antarcticus]
MEVTYITYYRVSTVRQGASGLGLDAQRSASENYCRSTSGKILFEFTEVESGKRSNRPELKAALEACRKTGATLLIAKLDRLARNVHFLSGLLESGVRCVAADMPNADRFMLHVYAAMAEEEGRRISERTRSALAAAKARGVRLGQSAERLAEINRDSADRFASKVGPLIWGWIANEHLTFRTVAERLNAMNVAPARGAHWYAATVHRVHHRYVGMNTK